MLLSRQLLQSLSRRTLFVIWLSGGEVGGRMPVDPQLSSCDCLIIWYVVNVVLKPNVIVVNLILCVASIIWKEENIWVKYNV